MLVPVSGWQGEAESRRAEEKPRLKLAEPDGATAEAQVWRGVRRPRARKEDLLGADRTPAQFANEVAADRDDHVVELRRDMRRPVVKAVAEDHVPVRPH